MKSVKTAWQHMRRSPYQSVAAIITLFVTFLLAGGFALSSISSAIILNFFESKPQITVFFTDKATRADATALEKSLEGTGKIADVKYVSKEEALGIYKEQNKDDPLLLEMVTADILPASLEVSATDPNYLKDLAPIMQAAAGVEEVIYQKDVVESLVTWTRAIRAVGGVLAGLLAFNSVLVIMTIISMKIALKKDEIEILRLIGASPWYIRSPFIIEGGWYGVIGAGLAWVTITGVVLWLRPVLLSFLGLIPSIQVVLVDPTSALFLAAAGGFLGILLVTGFLLGSFGSIVALGRFLKL